MSEHFDAADIAQAVEEAAIKSDIAPTKVDRRLVAAHDRIEKLEQQLAVSQSMQCTSPFEDSPPCRGIQRVKDELANATKSPCCGRRWRKLPVLGTAINTATASEIVWRLTHSQQSTRS